MTLVHGSETRSPDKGTELEGIRQKVFLDR